MKSVMGLLAVLTQLGVWGCGSAVGAGASAEGSAPGVDRVVVSRDFLKGPLRGRFELDGQTAREEPARWRDLPPVEDEPESGYLADFRDHAGCLGLASAPDQGVCFHVLPDVDSVKVAPDRVDARGLAALAGCDPERTEVRLTAAARGGRILRMEFSLRSASCSPTRAQLTLEAT